MRATTIVVRLARHTHKGVGDGHCRARAVLNLAGDGRLPPLRGARTRPRLAPPHFHRANTTRGRLTICVTGAKPIAARNRSIPRPIRAARGESRAPQALPGIGTLVALQGQEEVTSQQSIERRGHCHASSARAYDGPQAILSTGRSAAVGTGSAVAAIAAVSPCSETSVAILRRVQPCAGGAREPHAPREIAIGRFTCSVPRRALFFQRGREPS